MPTSTQDRCWDRELHPSHDPANASPQSHWLFCTGKESHVWQVYIQPGSYSIQPVHSYYKIMQSHTHVHIIAQLQIELVYITNKLSVLFCRELRHGGVNFDNAISNGGFHSSKWVTMLLFLKLCSLHLLQLPAGFANWGPFLQCVSAPYVRHARFIVQTWAKS